MRILWIILCICTNASFAKKQVPKISAPKAQPNLKISRPCGLEIDSTCVRFLNVIYKDSGDVDSITKVLDRYYKNQYRASLPNSKATYHKYMGVISAGKEDLYTATKHFEEMLALFPKMMVDDIPINEDMENIFNKVKREYGERNKPSISIIYPSNKHEVAVDSIEIKYTVNGTPFYKMEYLKEGDNIIEVDSTNEFGWKGSASVNVILNTRILRFMSRKIKPESTITDQRKIDYSNGITIKMNVEIGTAQGNQTYLFTDANWTTAQNGVALAVQNGMVIFEGYRGKIEKYNFRISAGNVDDEKPHQIVAVWSGDKSPDGVKLYLDGIRIGTAKAEAQIQKGDNIVVGGLTSAFELEDLRIYSRAFAEDEILKMLNE